MTKDVSNRRHDSLEVSHIQLPKTQASLPFAASQFAWGAVATIRFSFAVLLFVALAFVSTRCELAAAQLSGDLSVDSVSVQRSIEETGSNSANVSAIDVDGLRAHIEFLADDSLEGREAGSRGGRAAGNYLIEQFKLYGLEPLGEDGGYVQQFGGGYRNLLGYIEGSDPELKHEFIVIGAHYDHVGYGNASNSFGPTGRIHNGADDNASGTAGLVEILQGLSEDETRPARSILIALWDGEEKGLLGSIHWVNNPTVELSRIKLMINIDMIGRLREQGLEVYGMRTAPGLRRLASSANQDNLKLAFNWDVKEDSDHHPFFAKGIPILMYHTGLHGQYHRPSDDTETLNWEGLRDVSRMTLETAWVAANATRLPEFRDASRRETESSRRRFEDSRSPARPSRLGVTFSAGDQRVVIASTEPGGPARTAGLRSGDEVLSVNGLPVTAHSQLGRELLRSPNETELGVRRSDGTEETIAVTLRGNPIRVGLSWLPDAADPSVVLVTEVIPGSVAAGSGLQVGDRIYAVNGTSFDGSKDLLERLRATNGEVMLTTERMGRLSDVVLDLGN